jgi:polyferredoxin
VGTFTHKIHQSSFILMILVFILAFLFGAVFCGWVCPLGSVQEWVGKLGKRLFKKRYNHFIPRRIDQYLRYLRYIMLIWVLYATAMTGKLAFADIDPYYALFNFWTGEVAITGLTVLGITLLASLAVERPWCKGANMLVLMEPCWGSPTCSAFSPSGGGNRRASRVMFAPVIAP